MSHDLSCEPGADELEVRGRLRKLLGEEPDTAAAAPARPPIPPIPPNPAALPPRPRDWLDDILDAPATPEPEPAEATPADQPGPEPEAPAGKPGARKAKKSKEAKAAEPKHQAAKRRPAPGAPRSGWDVPTDPKQSLADAWDRIPHRLKWLAAHLAAAAAGWRLGIVSWATNTAAWFAAGHWASPSAFVVYGLGAGVWALHRRARAWAWPVAWAASIPISSFVVGVLLYGTGYHR